MKKTQREATTEELEDFNKNAENIIKLIKDNWNITASPKGYEELLKDSNYFLGNPEKCGPEVLPFDGIINITGASLSITEALTNYSTLYGEFEQGRSPIETLIGSILSYGIILGMEMKKREKDKEIEIYKRLLNTKS